VLCVNSESTLFDALICVWQRMTTSHITVKLIVKRPISKECVRTKKIGHRWIFSLDVAFISKYPNDYDM
jgi:hypothetical protein